MSGPAPKVRLRGDTVSHSRTTIDPQDCTAGVALGSNGNEYAYSATGTAQGTLLQTWLLRGVNSNYYARCTVNSGTLSAGTEDTWLQLNALRGWQITQTTVGTKTADIDIEIAFDASGNIILATANYTLSATVDL